MEEEEELSVVAPLSRWVSILFMCVVLGGMWFTPASAHQNGTDGTSPYTVEHASIQDSFYPPSVWNNWYIYLSPAHHWQGWKFGCNGYTEDLNMPLAAVEAAVGAGIDLAARGYYVRVGRADPDENVTRSNSWGSGYSKRRHIALHSNAVSNNSCGNGGGAGDGNKGTEVYYISTTGSNLALNLWNSLKGSSPGTEDSQVF